MLHTNCFYLDELQNIDKETESTEHTAAGNVYVYIVCAAVSSKRHQLSNWLSIVRCVKGRAHERDMPRKFVTRTFASSFLVSSTCPAFYISCCYLIGQQFFCNNLRFLHLSSLIIFFHLCFVNYFDIFIFYSIFYAIS